MSAVWLILTAKNEHDLAAIATSENVLQLEPTASKTNVRRSSLREPPASSLHGAPQENAPPTHAVSWAEEFVVALI